METRVGIIMANYNYGHYFLDGIESIKNQTYEGPITTYVVDDGSTDDSWEKNLQDLCKPKVNFGLDLVRIGEIFGSKD